MAEPCPSNSNLNCAEADTGSATPTPSLRRQLINYRVLPKAVTSSHSIRIQLYRPASAKQAQHVYFLRHFLNMLLDDLIDAWSGDVGGVSASLADKKLSRPSRDCLWLVFVSTTDSNDGLASSCCGCCCCCTVGSAVVT